MVGIERLVVVAIDAGIYGSGEGSAGCDDDRGDEIFPHGEISDTFCVVE
jgi:hypothetical protein